MLLGSCRADAKTNDHEKLSPVVQVTLPDGAGYLWVFLTRKCLLCFCMAERGWLEKREVFVCRYRVDDRELVFVRFLVFGWLVNSIVSLDMGDVLVLCVL